MAKSLVLEHTTADPTAARAHFASRLSVETDPSDVYADLMEGIDDFVIVDARSTDAYEKAHVKGAISIPHRTIDEQTTARLNKEQLVVVYCWGPACNAGAKAGLRFSSLGFKVKDMIGGFEYWVREGLPIEGTEIAEPDLVGFIG